MEMANDVVGLLDHLRIRRAHLVGFSMGAFIAGHLATTRADRLASVSFVGHHPIREWTVADERDAEASARDLETDTPFRSLLLAISPPDAVPTEERIRTSLENSWRRTIRKRLPPTIVVVDYPHVVVSSLGGVLFEGQVWFRRGSKNTVALRDDLRRIFLGDTPFKIGTSNDPVLKQIEAHYRALGTELALPLLSDRDSCLARGYRTAVYPGTRREVWVGAVGDLHRLRRQVAFDRLLARMFDPSKPGRDGWVLKGGYALEMRFHMARSTKDLDLTVRSAQRRAGDSTSLRERLQLAASIELPDFFTFIVGEAMAELNQDPEGGARFPVDARLDGRTFVKFHVDLGVGDEVLEPLESVEGEDWLGFAGIPAVVVPALSVVQHWAEKFHAYTRPRETPNSRVRDLVDLVLILEHETPATERVRMVVDATFQRRGTHPVPDVVPEPPSEWAKPFTALAAQCGLEQTLATAHERVEAFWRRIPGR